MENKLENIFTNILFINELKAKIFSLNQKEKIFTSPFAGSSRSLFIKSVFESEKQIFVLCSSVQSVNEIKVELSILDLEDSIVSIDDFAIDALQEKITGLNKKEKFILISTYELLRTKLPSKNSIDTNTTKIEIGGNITYEDLIEYFNSINYNRDKFVESPRLFCPWINY